MERRRLGSSDLVVSELALGTMIFGETGERGTPPDEAKRIIEAYLEAGGNHIDTANVYAGGRSEELIGEALLGRRDQVVLATKARFRHGDGPDDEGLSSVQIHHAVEASLRRLQTDYVDLLYFHAWDPWVPIEESLGAAADLIRAGKVRYAGVSNFKAWQLMKALDAAEGIGPVRFVAGQYQYNLVVRDIEREFVDLCESEGVGLVPWGPLGGGFLSGKYRPGPKPEEGRIAHQPPGDEEAWGRRDTARNWEIARVADEIARAGGWSTAQVALAWLLGRPAVSSVLLGVRTLGQLEDNLKGVEVTLGAEAMDRLDEASALAESYPYRFIEAYSARPPRDQ